MSADAPHSDASVPPDPDPDPDLDAVAADLADAEQALDRLGSGTYWTDEVTGEDLSDETLAEHPTARRAVYVPFGPPATPPHGVPRIRPAGDEPATDAATGPESGAPPAGPPNG
jgi:hypothetical protein